MAFVIDLPSLIQAGSCLRLAASMVGAGSPAGGGGGAGGGGTFSLQRYDIMLVWQPGIVMVT